MKLRKDGKPSGHTGAAMARTPKPGHPWKRSFTVSKTARKHAEQSGFDDSNKNKESDAGNRVL